MLTITETLDQIKTLDTDKDIIIGACRQFLGLSAKRNLLDNDEIAYEIVERYCSDKVCNSPGELIIACLKVAVSTTVSTVIDGKEVEVGTKLMQLLAELYSTAMAAELADRCQDDPNNAAEHFHNLMKQFDKKR